MDLTEIEAANRLRESMGLKPLPVPGAAPSQANDAPAPDVDEDPSATFEGRQAQAYENFQKIREAEVAKKERERRAMAAKRQRELAQRNVVLEGKGLGDLDEDEGDLDAKSWLKLQKKRLKKIEKAAKADKEAQKAKVVPSDYSSKDLAGIRVGHDASTFLDDGEQVLTLKDTTVLENEDEGDELENADVREQEKAAERLELRKRRAVYDPNNFDDTGSLLAQYDEEISGKKRKMFTLDAQGATTDVPGVHDSLGGKPKVQSLSLDVLNDVPASDYLDVTEVKVKKPKKKKKSKSTRQRPVDEDDILLPEEPFATVDENEMDVDSGPSALPKKRKLADDGFVDDDDLDLQASLTAARREALKKRKRMRPEDIAKQLREKSQSPSPEDGDDLGDETALEGGLVIDEISEFVGALKNKDEDEYRKPRTRSKPPQPSVTAMDEDSDDDKDSDDDVRMGNVEQEFRGLDEIDSLGRPDLTTTGVDEEKTVGQGVGAALQILKERGLIQGSGGADLNAQHRSNQAFLAEKQRRLAKIEEDARRQRERDRANGFLDRMSVKEREEYSRKQNTQRDFQTSKIMNEMFNRSYVPTFEIKYVDDHGRRLDQKDAFKHLSHQFHGKGSGKGKTDKLLKKIDAEKKREAQSMLDNSQDAGMGSGTQSKKRKDAGVRLA